MLRRILLALAVVTATTAVTLPASSADPASAQCPTDGTNAGVKVALSDTPVTVSVTDTRTGAPKAVVVTFTDAGTRFNLSGPPEPRPYAVDDASWCIKAAKGNTAPLIGTGATGASPASNKKGELLRIDYVTLYAISAGPRVFVCLNSSTPGAPDAEQVGAWDAKDNLAAWGSTDGTCV